MGYYAQIKVYNGIDYFFNDENLWLARTLKNQNYTWLIAIPSKYRLLFLVLSDASNAGYLNQFFKNGLHNELDYKINNHQPINYEEIFSIYLKNKLNLTFKMSWLKDQHFWKALNDNNVSYLKNNEQKAFFENEKIKNNQPPFLYYDQDDAELVLNLNGEILYYFDLNNSDLDYETINSIVNNHLNEFEIVLKKYFPKLEQE